VLAVTISVVFVIGLVKLVLVNKVMKKQEIVDEEKRVRIEELRKSGQIVESRRSHDIPFGVRAIQSGIQVDGIWISQSNTPATSQLKLSSGGSTPHKISTPEARSGHGSPDIRPMSKQSNQSSRMSEMEVLRRLQQAAAVQEATEMGDNRASFKPRKASHLRHGSHGEFDQTTLQQLEGTSTPKNPQVHRPRPSSNRHAEAEAESSAADNELSSGMSSHSDTSLSQNVHTAFEIRDNTPVKTSSQGRTTKTQSPVPSKSSNIENVSGSKLSPSMPSPDPFQTPLTSPNTRGSPIPSGSNSSQVSPGYPGTSSPFVPGELHVNKSSRKVNPGFEVLPAGTFKTPTDVKGKGIELDLNEDLEDQRQSSKLQKKPRTSMPETRM
jgi:hypothetical protein